MLKRGPSFVHPNPEFYYQPGGGPLFDVGPYYLTALIALLGPIRKVTGSEKIGSPTRTIMVGPRAGSEFPVNTPTHIASILTFADGPIATLTTSFDVWDRRLPFLEIYGTAGTIQVPDPGSFGGPILIRGVGKEDGRVEELKNPFSNNSRGLGAAEMAAAIRDHARPRASAELAYHVLDVMHSITESCRTDRHVEVQSSCDRPALFLDSAI